MGSKWGIVRDTGIPQHIAILVGNSPKTWSIHPQSLAVAVGFSI
jgi:hypothetical protein